MSYFELTNWQKEILIIIDLFDGSMCENMFQHCKSDTDVLIDGQYLQLKTNTGHDINQFSLLSDGYSMVKQNGHDILEDAILNSLR